MIKMAQLEHIRKLYHLEGLSIREISRITGHHRDTIAKYLNADSSDPLSIPAPSGQPSRRIRALIL